MPELSLQKQKRRHFIGSALAASVAPRVFASHGSSDPIRLAIVGLGSRGFNLIDNFLNQSDCRIVGVCDVADEHFRDQKWGSGRRYGRQAAKRRIRNAYLEMGHSGAANELLVESDFRKLISRRDVDAVVVATPDHWHAICTWRALDAGKDVYCEKPVTHLFAEGTEIVRKVAAADAVFQTGSQQRSAYEFRRVVEIVRNGLIGRVQSVEVGLPAGYSKPMGSTEVVSTPESLDYEFWCGPSEKLPLMQARHHRWWRGHRAYGGGVLMDWIGHHNDIAHWALDVDRSGPIQVEAVNWTFPESHVYNTPAEYTIRCEYPGGISSTISTGNKPGLKIQGDRGWVFVTRGKLQASNEAWTKPDFVAGDFQLPIPDSHAANFLNGIRSRSECVAPADVAHRSITPGHLGYVSQELNRALKWDSDRQEVIGDDEANTLLNHMEYRAPWTLNGSPA